MLNRHTFKNRQAWLQARGTSGIGASESAAVVGLSPWMTVTELWELKTGRTEQKEIKNDAIDIGVSLEPALRTLYAAEHPDRSVEHHPFDMLYQEEKPWLFATLDGEITTADGRKGVLEIKTSTPRSRKDWEKWDGKIPDNYLCQCAHQLLATGYDFVDLYVWLRDEVANEVIIRTYHMERADMQEDMDWLLSKEEAFWDDVVTGSIPAMTLSL